MSWVYAVLSVLVVSAIAFIGLWTFSIRTKHLHKILLYLVSFSAGALLGDAFLHLLPEAVEESGFGVSLGIYVLLGILVSFLIEKALWRHCHVHGCGTHFKPFAVINLLGDGVHNFIDGLIIGGSYLVSVPLGLSTTLAVIFHEIPQEIGDFGVLVHGGFTRAKALFFNFLSAVSAVAGVIVAFLLSETVGVAHVLVPFSAGSFIYIACTDLLPELHKSVSIRESAIQVLSFILGIAVMVALLIFFE